MPSPVALRWWTVQRLLRQAQQVLPESAIVVLLADRGFADGKLMKYLNQNLGWHFRIRSKQSFAFYYQHQWRKVAEIQLQPGQAWFTRNVGLGKTKPDSGVYLAFAHDESSDERWVIASGEPTSLKTFSQYRLCFSVEESFLDLKSNGFNLEASPLRDKHALSQLCGVVALRMLFLILQGVQVVESGNRRYSGYQMNKPQ